jgi:hypothetical protein
LLVSWNISQSPLPCQNASFYVNSANEDSVNILYSEFKYGNDNAAAGESSTKGNSQAMFLELQTPAINGQF